MRSGVAVVASTGSATVVQGPRRPPRLAFTEKADTFVGFFPPGFVTGTSYGPAGNPAATRAGSCAVMLVPLASVGPRTYSSASVTVAPLWKPAPVIVIVTGA